MERVSERERENAFLRERLFSFRVGEARATQAMASEEKTFDRAKPSSSGAKVGEQAIDLGALLKLFIQHLQVSPASREETGKSGSSKRVGEEASPCNAKAGTKTQSLSQETDKLCKQMSEILHNRKYKDGDRLSKVDDMAVRDVLMRQHDCKEKVGPGINYIKIHEIRDKGTRCFWLVRVDGTKTDFSLANRLKDKASKNREAYQYRKLRLATAKQP